MKDSVLIFSAKLARTFAYGLLTVSLAVYLAKNGFSPFQIGLVLSVSVLGGLTSTVLVSLLADRYGRRRSLMMLSFLTSVSAVVLLVSTTLPTIAAALFLGSLSLTGGEIGPFLTIEQSILPQVSTEAKRNRTFSNYNFVGYAGLSSGTLFGIVPGTLENLGYDLHSAYRPIFLSLLTLGLVLYVIYRGLSRNVEASEAHPRSRISVPRTSAGNVARLSVLFGMDSFSGGFVIQSIITYWFYARYGMSQEILSIVIALGQTITAVSVLAAPRLVDIIGLLNTMVYTHLVSNLFLISIPFAPSTIGAIVFYLARQSLSQMDVPTRQAYVMMIVPASERTAAAGTTTFSRNLGQSVSPSIAGYLFQILPISLGTPFIIGGTMKIVYDLLLYKSFRHVAAYQEPKQAPPAIKAGAKSTVGGPSTNPIET